MMEKRKSFSRFDYLLMLFEEFKDQFTLVLIFHIFLFFTANQLDFLFKQYYLFSSFKDYFNELSAQFVLNDFFKILGFIYLFGAFIHFGIYKKNITWLFYLNASLVIIATTYVWCIPTFESIKSIVLKGHVFFIFSIVSQLVVYSMVGNEIYRFIKKNRKQAEINHS